MLVIDLFGLSANETRTKFPQVYQWVVERVRSEREQNNRVTYRDNWWIFGEPRSEFRPALAGLQCFIATVETSRHRTFQFLDQSVLPDNKLIAVALCDPLHMGVLSSDTHIRWALAAGSWLGVGNDPVYVKTRCFETFPFPNDDTGLTPELTTRIRALAEHLDAHRKTQQAAHADLTLTGMYNVLEKLRRSEPLNAKDKVTHEHGLVSVLKSLHDELDAAVLQAYGWGDLTAPLADHLHGDARAAAVDTLLERLVALNARRAAEEAAGTVRWLRPDFQLRGAAVQSEMDVTTDTEADTDAGAIAAPTAPAVPAARQPWPAGLHEQIKAVAELLSASPAPLALADIEARFSARGRWRDRLPTILDTLEALGRARRAQPGAERWQAA